MSAPPSLDTVYRRSPRMVSRRIGGQSVLVPISGNVAEVDSLYTLNRVGAFVWDRLDGAADGHSLVAEIVRGFEVEAAVATEDYLAFVGQLLEIGALLGPDAV